MHFNETEYVITIIISLLAVSFNRPPGKRTEGIRGFPKQGKTFLSGMLYGL